MHDGGLLGNKLLDFVPGANFQVLQIISIIIIKRGVNITPPSTLLYTPHYKYIYIYWNCLFSYSFIYYDRHLRPNGWRYFFYRNRAQI